MTRTPLTAVLGIAIILTGVASYILGNVPAAHVCLAAMAIMVMTFKDT